MKNLCITLHIKTPIIPGKYPLNLDGLLYWAAFEGCDEDKQKAFDIVDRALDANLGVYKSSDMIYLHTPQHALTQGEAVFSTNFDWREYQHPTKRKSVMELGGPYRSRLTTYASINCQAVRFYAVGDPDVIRFLIDSAGFIGRGNNQGHGEISEIVIEEIDKDLSWYKTEDDNSVSLQRSLPVKVAETLSSLKGFLSPDDQTLIRTKPPYTTSKEDLGYSTSFKREVLISL